MLKRRKDIITSVLIAIHFLMITYAHLNFDFTVDAEISNEYNDFCFDVEAIGKFFLIFAFFYYSIGVTKCFLRVLLMASVFKTLNELVGLNNYLDSVQFPIFWTVMVATAIYSFIKYRG